MQKKKILKLIIGSNNQGKIKEIKDLIPKNIDIYTPKDFNLKSPKESGKSFEENSFIKAKFFSKNTKKISLADDSGLEIDLINGEPGIYSARWAGKYNNFNIAIKKVYKKLMEKDKYWYKKKQKARFICALTIFWSNRKFITVKGKIEGSISKNKRGKNGFGYDPIFIPNGFNKTFAEMSSAQKNKISHRALAIIKLKNFLIN